jgi:hypothetical protein
MKKGPSLRGLSVLVTFTLLVFIPTLTSAAEVSKGNVLGFIYAQDGTTPVSGAVVKARNISTGAVYESNVSDTHGVFKLSDVESGLYVYGVKTSEGDFNSEGIIGLSLSDSSTAKMAISLAPFTEKALADLKAGIEANNIQGENLIGRILDYDPETQMAEIYVLQHGITQKDRIHTLGVETDFYQDVKLLEVNGKTAETVAVGESARIALNENAMQGDFVYLVASRGIGAIALLPVGTALLVGGSAAVIKVNKGEATDTKDEPDAVSPYKK